MSVRRMKSLLVVVFASLTLGSPAVAGSASNAQVNGSCVQRGCGTWVYSRPSGASKRVKWLANGSKVHVVCASSRWARIGKSRYVRYHNLKASGPIFSCKESDPLS